MVPTLAPGDHVFVDPRAACGTGDVVVVRHPFKRDVILIKRLGRVTPAGRLELVSDNPAEGTDSRGFGAVSPELVVGRAVARL